MRQIFLILCAFAAASPVRAAADQAELAFYNPQDGANCYRVYAMLPWQRVPMARDGNHVLEVRGGEGWSVDAERYDRVGPEGHGGRAAAALHPYDRYKLIPKVQFGALLVRGARGDILAAGPRAGARVDAGTDYVEVRINDSDASLGDNNGSLIVCATN